MATGIFPVKKKPAWRVKEEKEIDKEKFRYKLIVIIHNIKRGIIENIKQIWPKIGLEDERLLNEFNNNLKRYLDYCDQQICIIEGKESDFERKINEITSLKDKIKKTLDDLEENISIILANLQRMPAYEENIKRAKQHLINAIKKQKAVISEGDFNKITALKKGGALDEERRIITEEIPILSKQKVREEIKPATIQIPLELWKVIKESEYALYSNSSEFNKLPGYKPDKKGAQIIIPSKIKDDYNIRESFKGPDAYDILNEEIGNPTIRYGECGNFKPGFYYFSFYIRIEGGWMGRQGYLAIGILCKREYANFLYNYLMRYQDLFIEAAAKLIEEKTLENDNTQFGGRHFVANLLRKNFKGKRVEAKPG